jgi:hypothetical protein
MGRSTLECPSWVGPPEVLDYSLLTSQKKVVFRAYIVVFGPEKSPMVSRPVAEMIAFALSCEGSFSGLEPRDRFHMLNERLAACGDTFRLSFPSGFRSICQLFLYPLSIVAAARAITGSGSNHPLQPLATNQ